MRMFRSSLLATALLGVAGAMASADATPAQAPTPRGSPATVDRRPDIPAGRVITLDPARIVAEQMRREKAGDRTSQLSGDFKAAYDAVPRDEDNLGATILGGGYDVPDRVVRVSDLTRDDTADPPRATAAVTLHYTNPDAPKPSFDRTIVVAFVREVGRWRIDDVRLIDLETDAQRKAGHQIWLKRGFQSLGPTKPGARRG